jgi:hypothetical protein
MKTYSGRCKTPLIPKIGVRWKSVVSLAPRPTQQSERTFK